MWEYKYVDTLQRRLNEIILAIYMMYRLLCPKSSYQYTAVDKSPHIKFHNTSCWNVLMQLLQRNVVGYGKLLWQATEWDMNQAHDVHMSSGLLLQRQHNLESVNIHIYRHYRYAVLGWADFFLRENLCIVSPILLDCVCFFEVKLTISQTGPYSGLASNRW